MPAAVKPEVVACWEHLEKLIDREVPAPGAAEPPRVFARPDVSAFRWDWKQDGRGWTCDKLPGALVGTVQLSRDSVILDAKLVVGAHQIECNGVAMFDGASFDDAANRVVSGLLRGLVGSGSGSDVFAAIALALSAMGL